MPADLIYINMMLRLAVGNNFTTICHRTEALRTFFFDRIMLDDNAGPCPGLPSDTACQISTLCHAPSNLTQTFDIAAV